MNRRCIGLDLGNTRVKGWTLGGTPAAKFSHAIRTEDWIAALFDWRCATTNVADAGIHWWIASVHPLAFDRLQHAIAATFPQDRLQAITRRDVPMETTVRHPERLGIDRLLSGWAAWRIVGDGVLVADAGSAITIDWVDGQGVFRGGAIVPGVDLQLRSLGEYAPALAVAVDQVRNALDDGSTERFRYPGDDTASAIAAGVYAGAAGTIEFLIRQIQRESAGDVAVVLTGGDAEPLSRLINMTHQVLPDLMRDAISTIADANG